MKTKIVIPIAAGVATTRHGLRQQARRDVTFGSLPSRETQCHRHAFIPSYIRTEAGRCARLLVTLFLTCSHWLFPVSSHAQDINLDTDYRNIWLNTTNLAESPYSNYFGIWPEEALTNASTTVFGGSVLDNSKSVEAILPTCHDGSYGLLQSAFGQPVVGIQADFRLGDVITPPRGTDTNQPPANFTAVPWGDNTAAYYEATNGGAFWSPSTRRVIAAQPNNVQIDWITTDGKTNTQVVNINAVPAKRPAKLFWTEDPYDSPNVNLSGLFPVPHYNTQVPPPTYVVSTNGVTNYTSGVWLDSSKQLHATKASGMFIIEYYQEGTYSQDVVPDYIEVVQVLAPDIQVLNADIGGRLLPNDLYWAGLEGQNGVIPNVTRGLNDSVFVYTQRGPKQNWAFSIKNTLLEPWAAQVVWQEVGVLDVQWPYEVDWNSCDWPAHPQLLVLGNSPTDQTPVLIPNELGAEVMPEMDPPLHASISGSGKTIRTTEPGLCLAKYTTSDNIWFEVIQTVRSTNTAYFDLEPNEWTIGQEVTPGDPTEHALQFNGVDSEAVIGTSFLNLLHDWTLSFWFSAQDFRGATIYSEGSDTNGAFDIAITTNGQLQVSTRNQVAGSGWNTITIPDVPVQSNQWHYLTLVYTNGSDTNGTLEVHLDDYDFITNGLPRVNFDGQDQTVIGTVCGTPAESDWFLGKFDELRIWNEPLDSDQINSNRYASSPMPADSAIASFPCDEGDGFVINNTAGDRSGTLSDSVIWTYGQTFPDEQWLGYPGYIHLANALSGNDRYNINRYAFPTENTQDQTNSHIFAVNKGTLEVWWSNLSRQEGMPSVYYTSRVVNYTNVWPTNAPEMVIASGLGSSAPELPQIVLADPSIYFQNDPGAVGYNPNEEHALLLGNVAYALRDDLNQTNATNYTSDPFVLVDYLDATSARPKMQLYHVVTTNSAYNFERPLTAGFPILPPEPLAAFPPAASTISDTGLPAWRDRKLDWWAASAGNDGGTADAAMRFWYQMQPPFYFPALPADEQPAIGSELPWLPSPSSHGGTEGLPVAVTYHISWPADVPKLHLGQTLTTPVNGLPDIYDQLSVEIPYQQSWFTTTNDSVVLYDPIQDRAVPLDSSVVDNMIAAKLARKETTSPRVRFPNLPPSLYPRVYYDPTRATGMLVIEGQLEQPLTGPDYLLLNMLQDYEVSQMVQMAAGLDSATQSAWDNAVLALPESVLTIQPNDAYVRSALGARLSKGSGYVTLAFNNSTNSLQVPSALPVSLSVIQVDTKLYSGILEVIKPEDALAEQLSMRIGADFAGYAEDCEFRWRWADPVGGLPPDVSFISTNWLAYEDRDTLPGASEVTISGASQFTLADHYFAVQYRPLDTSGPSGTNWSDWTYQLAPGWVVRAMTGIDPFMQVYEDTIDHAVDTRSTMIQEAGGPYEGEIALNLDEASQAGLIPTYETIFNRAKEFSLLADVTVPSINQTLLFAAGRLRDLYMLLGNEAYADAADPTIAFPDDLSLGSIGGQSTSIFPFMNQEPNELEEELALLRGRDDTLEPGVETSPVYNRLIWNFTQGINAGEPAYAYNYDIEGNSTNTTGVIDAEDAKRLYPQGHGDAWGHYLSAIGKYYDLLAFTNFMWQTVPGATLVGSSVTVSTDFEDEQKFAETAAARARTGAQIVKDTFRERYSEDPTGRWPQFYDSDTNRAWGIAGWSSRAGQAAYYDWATANSLMWDTLTNTTQVGGADAPPEGIQKVDRESTFELSEIASGLNEIQSVLDSADGGLNPLGLAKNVVPFDIDPTATDPGASGGSKTHFEQVYDRALQAVYNACLAYNHARGVTLALNQQSESLHALDESLSSEETDYHNRLIEIYGYPYSDDIGPTGNYPQGYDGPDLLDWQYIDMSNLVTHPPTGTNVQISVQNLTFEVDNNFSGTKYGDYTGLKQQSFVNTNDIATITINVADNGLKVKPSTWFGQRRAQGELQLAMSDYVQAWYSLQEKKASYDQTLAELETDVAHRLADYDRYPDEWKADENNATDQSDIAKTIAQLKNGAASVEIVLNQLKDVGFLALGVVPKETAGLIGPFPTEQVTEDLGALAKIPIALTEYAQKWTEFGLEVAQNNNEATKEGDQASLEALINGNQYQDLLQWNTADTMVKLRDQFVKQAELQAQLEALSQAQQRIQKLLAEGQRLITERAEVRSRAAQRIQMGRYADISFRLYRNDTLRRYQAAFDLAARYTYLAAKAYDYETGLLPTDNNLTPGNQFLEGVVRARLPGRFFTWLGEPMAGGSVGEPGLADILARMKADWDVVKGRFGFNNPETETSRFSLRTELFRIAPDASGDATWAQVLQNNIVSNLNQLPEFRRYCRPFSSTTNVEPGIVLSFPTYVIAGRNFFGFDLAGGDNAYDASHASTKIRSVGVWFTGYNNTFNTNSTGSGLANEPRVYLVPVGLDILRSPTGDATRTRSYNVFDQAIPLPYNIGGADIDNPDWSPVVDSLQEPFGQLRQFASFRAYHDSGNFDSSETITASRLIGRSVWNTGWLLIIPGRTLLSDPNEGIERFIYGAQTSQGRDGNGVKDIKMFFQTYSISGD